MGLDGRLGVGVLLRELGIVGQAIAAFERVLVTGPSPYDYAEQWRPLADLDAEDLADEQYHNIGIGMDKPEPDLGRFVVTKDAKDTGAFKTPTVRNVALTAPYMHDGSVATLEEVVEWYDKGGHPNPHLSDKIKPLNLTAEERADLVAFMQACTGPTPPVETGRLPAAADL